VDQRGSMDDLVILEESADTPESRKMISELDDYLNSLYPGANNHLLSVEDLLKPGVTFLVARINGEAAGCGALREVEGFGEIKRMHVSPAFRGTGLGLKILGHLFAVAPRRGYKVVKLETGNLNLER
jgi:putative acetyltransferase